MVPAAPPRRCSGPDRAEARVDRVPVQRVPPGGEVVGAPVLVLEVVGMLPYVDAQDRRQLVDVWAVLVWIVLDRELALPVCHQPRPAAAEPAPAARLELLLDLVVSAQGVLQDPGDAPSRVARAGGP